MHLEFNPFFEINDLLKYVRQSRLKSHRIIFTNGCFDLLHPGHIHILDQCKKIGGKVIVGMNSDSSVRLLKGKNRPVMNQKSRAIVLQALLAVDAVILFDSLTPIDLIRSIQPDALVKGGDYDARCTNEQDKRYVVGSKEVKAYGGEVYTIPLLKHFSTTQIINQIRK